MVACLQIGRGANGVERLRKREQKDDPWSKLRLPDGHKELVQSLINSHFAKRKIGDVHFDLMRNKGISNLPRILLFYQRNQSADYLNRKWRNNFVTWCSWSWQDIYSRYVELFSVPNEIQADDVKECAAISNGRPLLPVTCGMRSLERCYWPCYPS